MSSLNARIIHAPSEEVVRMLTRRMPPDLRKNLDAHSFSSIGLVMVNVPDLYFYADIVQKVVNVTVSEIFGSCPQHITTLAFWGETSAVNTAMQAIESSSNTVF